ncbi:acyl-CoA thioesterase [Sphingomonas sp. GlSt437]|uniref:acyl-CoA thioesterase n=1 Tax=Sphingomonas sp. GlSt437 TaxID=3389970 RepID=UPI003A8521EE
MPRPAPERLSPDHYPHHDIIQTRFQDLDILGHINNVAMAVLFESARVRFNRAIGLLRPSGHRFLVARVEVNYLAEGGFPDDVAAYHGIGRIGTRSWEILGLLAQNGTPIATADVTLVMSAETGATELPEDLRATLGEWRVRAV